MNLDWSRFPSLTALRAFEAAARTKSFSAAARALNVTHAAVAQQVRSLEDHLGVELLFRDGRGLDLTPEGARLAQGLADGFGTIATALSELAPQGAGAALRVTMTPAFAAQWLMPRLGRFWAAHPGIALTLHPDERVVDLRREGLDLGIRFGAGSWPGVEAELLTPADYVIVGAPALLKGRHSLTLDDMSALPWVIESQWAEALAWLRSLGLRPDAMNIAAMPTEELALSAARQGYGLYVEAAALVDADIAAGRLVRLGQLGGDGLAYYMVTRPGPRRPDLKTFMKWMRAAV